MSSNYPHPVPEESYSRALDKDVQQEELPYGYEEHYEMPRYESEKGKNRRL